MSGTARGLLDGRFSARSLGSYPLKDFDAPEPLYQLQADGLAERFPRPRVTPRRSHRTLILIGAAIIGLIVAAVAAVIVSRSGAGAGSLVEANNVGVIDPATNRSSTGSGRQPARPCRLRGRVGLGQEHRGPKPDSARRLQAHERGPGHARQPNTDRDRIRRARGPVGRSRPARRPLQGRSPVRAGDGHDGDRRAVGRGHRRLRSAPAPSGRSSANRRSRVSTRPGRGENVRRGLQPHGRRRRERPALDRQQR